MFGQNVWSRVRKWLSAAGADDGVALATVAAISAILFLLATTLIMLATQEQVSASNQVQRTKALHAADAGVSAYLYYLSRDSQYASKVSDIASSTTEAQWTVHATPPGPGSAVTLLTAVGSIPAQGGQPAVSRTVKATVKPGAFSDYMFLFNNYLNLGSGGIVKGNVRSNSYVNNDGRITGYTYAATTIGGSGVFEKYPLYPNYGTQSFAVVDFASLQSMATTDGAYFGDSGTWGVGNNARHYLGYNVVFGGTGGTLSKIQSISTTSGVMVVDASTVASFTIPPNGVMYFDDPVWLGGNYGAKVTVVVGKTGLEDPGTDSTYGRNAPGMGSSTSQPGINATTTTSPKPNKVNSAVFLWKNLQSADTSNPDYVCGIVTKGDISIISEYPDTVTPTNLTIQAAMLSTEGSIHADWTTGRVKNYLKILGAEAMWDQGFVNTTSGNTVTMGFKTRDYWYDSNLDVTTPPNFPSLGDGTLKVKSWVEN